jgi:hypothetical protein
VLCDGFVGTQPAVLEFIRQLSHGSARCREFVAHRRSFPGHTPTFPLNAQRLSILSALECAVLRGNALTVLPTSLANLTCLDVSRCGVESIVRRTTFSQKLFRTRVEVAMYSQANIGGLPRLVALLADGNAISAGPSLVRQSKISRPVTISS